MEQCIQLASDWKPNNMYEGIQRIINKEDNDDQEITLLKQASMFGETYAMVNLGVSYSQGGAVKRTPEITFQLFQTAAEKGNSFAMLYLGICYSCGIGVTEDKNNAKNP